MNNENNYKKYIAKNINKNINKNITTYSWLLPNKLLSINRCENKNKLIKASIIKKRNCCKKYQKKELLEKDYNI